MRILSISEKDLHKFNVSLAEFSEHRRRCNGDVAFRCADNHEIFL